MGGGGGGGGGRASQIQSSCWTGKQKGSIDGTMLRARDPHAQKTTNLV